jgi:RHS repeat-associated protein
MIYGYDDNGNVLSKVSATETVTYEYDFENHLIRAVTTQGAMTNVASFAYDAYGLRVQEIVNGDIVNYLVDSNRPFAQVLLETDGAGDVLASYVYGDDLISMKRGSDTFYYLYDGQMSVRQLTDISENVTDDYTYDAFGSLLASTGDTVNNYLFVGEQYDPDLNAYYLRARYYNPTTGRFMTMDPFEGFLYDPPSLHKYLYAHADPVNGMDPSGLLKMPSLLVSFRIVVMNAARAGARVLPYLRKAKIVQVIATAVVATSQVLAPIMALIDAERSVDVPIETEELPRGINIWFGGVDTPETTAHIRDAIISNPRWLLLHYIRPGHDRGWWNLARHRHDQRCGKGITGGNTGKDCDEYPFASALQGGESNNPSLRAVTSSDNQKNGRQLWRFLSRCKLEANDPIYGAYLVIPTGGIPVPWICRQ